MENAPRITGGKSSRGDGPRSLPWRSGVYPLWGGGR
jgi:hypothetical protein